MFLLNLWQIKYYRLKSAASTGLSPQWFVWAFIPFCSCFCGGKKVRWMEIIWVCIFPSDGPLDRDWSPEALRHHWLHGQLRLKPVLNDLVLLCRFPETTVDLVSIWSLWGSAGPPVNSGSVNETSELMDIWAFTSMSVWQLNYLLFKIKLCELFI